MPNCHNCQEKCKQAEMAHEAAKRRMYATNEFIELLKKVESGQLVEVVRCRDCKHRGTDYCIFHIKGEPADEELLRKLDNDFCSYGERKDGDGNG